MLVGLCGFVLGPYPVQDVEACGCNQKAPSPGVGSVYKYLVVDAEAIDVVGDVDEPESIKASFQAAPADVVASSDLRY